MIKHRLKSSAVEKQIVGTYKKIENIAVSGYQSIENKVVGTYKKIEGKFVEKFLDKEISESLKD